MINIRALELQSAGNNGKRGKFTVEDPNSIKDLINYLMSQRYTCTLFFTKLLKS